MHAIVYEETGIMHYLYLFFYYSECPFRSSVSFVCCFTNGKSQSHGKTTALDFYSMKIVSVFVDCICSEEGLAVDGLYKKNIG